MQGSERSVYDLMDLSGKVAIVTGADRSLSLAFTADFRQSRCAHALRAKAYPDG